MRKFGEDLNSPVFNFAIFLQSRKKNTKLSTDKVTFFVSPLSQIYSVCFWQLSEPLIIRQFKHGQSNPTYYVEYGGQRLVIRKKPVSVLSGGYMLLVKDVGNGLLATGCVVLA